MNATGAHDLLEVLQKAQHDLGDARHIAYVCRWKAGLAQLVEQWFCKPKVGGSSPSTGTIRPEI